VIVLRGLAAILLGLAVASVVNGLVLSGAGAFPGVLPDGGLIRWPDEVPLVILLAPVLSAPCWILFCLLVLPFATWRARAGRRLSHEVLGAVSLPLGAALMLPVGLFVGVENRLLLLFALFGGVGAAALVTCWSLLVLDRLAPRNSSDGVTLG